MRNFVKIKFDKLVLTNFDEENMRTLKLINYQLICKKFKKV